MYNGQAHIEKTIKSVINQTYDHIEYIIIDGGSKDGTLEVIKAYDNRINYWRSEPDGGIYDAMNKGVSLSGGETIGILNCGDTYEPWFVSTMVEKLRGTEVLADVVMYSHFNAVFEELGLAKKYRGRFVLYRGMPICHQAMLIGRNVYALLGLYVTSYKFAADYEYFLRMATGGVRFIEVDAYGVSFLLGGQSSSEMPASHREARAISRNYFGAFSFCHFAFSLKSARELLILYYGKRLLYRLAGDNVTNAIRRFKKTVLR